MNYKNYDIESDLKELTTMALSLEQYITQDELFYTPEGMFSNNPPMTLGTLVLRLRRITALQEQVDAGSRAQLGIAIQSHKSVVEDWAQHYQQKVEQEIQSRLHSITTFLTELNESPDKAWGGFMPELYARTAIEELLYQSRGMFEFDETLLDAIGKIDGQLTDVTHDGYFHWDSKLRQVYPQERFWWLYRQLDKQTQTA